MSIPWTTVAAPVPLWLAPRSALPPRTGTLSPGGGEVRDSESRLRLAQSTRTLQLMTPECARLFPQRDNVQEIVDHWGPSWFYST